MTKLITLQLTLFASLVATGCVGAEEPDSTDSEASLATDEGSPVAPDDALLDDPAAAPETAATCAKHVYVHIISYGATNYSTILNNKNSCWGLEAPKNPGGATWAVCHWNAVNPSGKAHWAYDDVNLGAAGHADASDVANCKARNGGVLGTVYVAADSGPYNNWSHAGIAGAARFFNECYDSDSLVKNRLSGCTATGAPMWNIGASGNAYADTLALCKSRANGQWLSIYASSVGLSGKEAAITKALNDCTL
jgi:hypothetical protein